jgi:hypothetical protein
VSIYAPHPSWQAATVPGIPAVVLAFPTSATFRTVPDISLDSSPANAPYAYCTSDTSSFSTGQASSCTSGFRDTSSTGVLTVAGGTSFAAPIFAGMLALINQAKGYTGGQGVINPTLYTLASTPATYSSAFHDITSGGNQCLAGTSYCSGAPVTDYISATGYDLASGLGSVDLANLITAWPKNTTTAASFTLSATSPTTPNGTTTTSTITVTPAGGYTGSVAFRITALTTVPYACFAVSNATITGSAAVTASVTITTDVATCPSGTTPFVVAGSGSAVAALRQPAAPSPRRWPQPVTAALAAVLCLAGLSRRKRLHHKLLRSGLTLGLLLMLGLSGLGLSGCSNGSNNTPTTTTTTTTTTTVTTPAGAYPLTVTGYNPTNSSQAATASLTLTVQ